MSAKNLVMLRVSPLADGRLRLRRQRFGAARIELLVPVHHPRDRDHDHDADQADENLRPRPVRDLDQEEMPGEGKEDAETKDLERMLAADDSGTESAPFQIRPIARDEAHRDERKNREMDQAQRIEIRLVDRVDEAVDEGRDQLVHARKMPGERHHHGEQQVRNGEYQYGARLDERAYLLRTTQGAPCAEHE